MDFTCKVEIKSYVMTNNHINSKLKIRDTCVQGDTNFCIGAGYLAGPEKKVEGKSYSRT